MAKHSRWTKEEDELLKELLENTEKTLLEISKEFPNRTRDAIQSRKRTLSPSNKLSELWTEEKVERLKSDAPTKTVTQISLDLGIKRGTVYKKMKELDLLYYNDPKYKPWTEEEDEYIRQKYLLTSFTRIAEKLDRTSGAVIQRATSIGCKKSSPKKWTKEDVDFLIDNYEKTTIEDLVFKLDRKASAVYNKAYELGLGGLGSKLKKEEELFVMANADKKTDVEIANILSCSTDKVSEIRKANDLFKLGNEIKGDTYIEKMVKEILEENDISYIFNEKLGNYRPDFQIVGENKVIEVQGDYWHCNPYVYKNGPKDAVQLKHVVNDYYKKCFYLSSGYEVLYIWERDLVHSFENVKESLLNFVLPSPREI